jgi:hypothetical protein
MTCSRTASEIDAFSRIIGRVITFLAGLIFSAVEASRLESLIVKEVE